MAKVTIRYLCGCGFNTSSYEEAVKHSDSTQHSLTISGEVRQLEKKPRVLRVIQVNKEGE